MIGCDAARAEFHSYLMGELDPPVAQAVRAHVDACAECKKALGEAAAAHRLLVAAPLEHSPGPRLEEEVFSLVELDRVGGLASDAGLGAEPPDELERAALDRAGVIAAPARRSRATTVLVPSLAVATVVLGVLGINWRSQADRMRDDFGAAGDTMQLVDLASSPEPPEDTTVEFVRYGDGNYKLVLEGDVPPAPAGYYYEVWMSGPAGRVSCGTFTVGDDSLVHNFPVGVDPRDYPFFEVTLEPDDGNEEMNGVLQWEGRLDLVDAAP
ncbi:MAG: anti-sigma factor [Actinomycetota bacterium]|nr:anti-sigma factor [Actinomycetota bacterium]